MNDNIFFFMYAFMYELEGLLNKNLEYFDDIRFYFDESNTDQQIKIKIKEFVLKNFKGISNVTKVIDNSGKTYILNDDFHITNIKVPFELTNEDKKSIRNLSSSVYTNPDLLLFLTDGSNEYMIPIEVKSTKNDKIPGSSIQQIDVNGWVIFLKHDERHILEFVTGKYIDSISGTVPFPDRSPRPQVSYSILKKWNEEYRSFSNGTLSFTKDKTIEDKIQLVTDWQILLAKQWLKTLESNKKKNSEPWFNNNIRKFSILLLEHYETLSDDDKRSYIEFIKNNITGEDDE